jgi:3-hydroxyisobutyrate dehydrogenase
MARIAFIGLGKMGLGMAGRLLAAGYQLNVYNRTPAKAATLVERGARLCVSPAEACEEAEAVISMVADDAASREVWLGDDGVLAGMGRRAGEGGGGCAGAEVGARTREGERKRAGEGQNARACEFSAPRGESLTGSARARGVFAIECSTLSHDWVAELALAVRSRGLRYIDAPVTGLPDTAAAGELTLLVGADAADLDGARPILGAFSQRIIHFGAVGTGTAYKLIINMLGAVQIASAAESMALAERAGLDLEVVAEAIATGQAASPQVARNTRRMVEGDRNRNITFAPRLRLKDVDYALRLARKLDLGAPFGGLAAQAFRQLCDGGHADENESNVIMVAREQRF